MYIYIYTHTYLLSTVNHSQAAILCVDFVAPDLTPEFCWPISKLWYKVGAQFSSVTSWSRTSCNPFHADPVISCINTLFGSTGSTYFLGFKEGPRHVNVMDLHLSFQTNMKSTMVDAFFGESYYLGCWIS